MMHGSAVHHFCFCALIFPLIRPTPSRSIVRFHTMQNTTDAASHTQLSTVIFCKYTTYVTAYPASRIVIGLASSRMLTLRFTSIYR